MALVEAGESPSDVARILGEPALDTRKMATAKRQWILQRFGLSPRLGVPVDGSRGAPERRRLIP